MSDNKSEPLTAELITNCMREVSQEIGMMAADDPRLSTALREFSQRLQLRRAIKSASDSLAEQCMDQLAREMARLKSSDPRRTQIVEEIMRLAARV